VNSKVEDELTGFWFLTLGRLEAELKQFQNGPKFRELKNKHNGLFLSKRALAGSFKNAKNFGVYQLHFGGPLSEISDQNFQNCENIRDILKMTFT